jgi:HD superfamily phosphohydrolase YqeK
MMFVFLKQGNLLQLAELNELDTLSVVIAAICHDFAHDGLNNAYHVNAIS